MTISIVLLALHLLGVGLVVGAVFATLFFTIKNSFDSSASTLHLQLRKLGTIGAGVAIVTGIIMAYQYKIPLRSNWSFDTKLILIAADGLIANFAVRPVLEKVISDNNAGNARSKLLAWAWLSVVIVAAIVVISVYRGKLYS